MWPVKNSSGLIGWNALSQPMRGFEFITGHMVYNLDYT